MGNHNIAHLLILLLNLGTLLISLACPYCPYPTPPTKPPRVRPPKVKPPPSSPKLPPKPPHKHPPTTKPSKPPAVKPPSHVPKPTHPVVPTKPPSVLPPIIRPPILPKPPVVYPPVTPKPPTGPNPPVITPPLCPPPPPPKAQETCPIDTLKLDACVDVLGGLIHIGIGADAKDKCCPVIKGLVDLDAALCLCTTIKAKLLNIKIFIPIALRVLVDCGKHPPPGFQCPA